MTTLKAFIFIILFSINFISLGQGINVSKQKEIAPQSSNTNPLDIRILTLKNGLTVYLNQDNNMNSVIGAMVVRGGAKYDPDDATGIAHYLEHMLFKGTNKIGTKDYESEKIWLDSISFMYSMLPYTTGDEAYRNRVYKKIDYYSQKAAKYAIPGEFDKLINLMGGDNLNAYTDFEKIVYHNEFPTEFTTEWLTLYKERFENAVFRLFQTELETVFEEKNMSQDNIYVNVYEEVYKDFYPNSSYGNRTVLGSIEHLKNPSIQKMVSYYKEYYSSNNMALILVGNFNQETVINEIEDIFGNYRNGEDHKLKKETESPFNGRTQKEANLTPIPMGILGFRVPGQFHNDIPGLDLITNMLNNRQNTGLLDSINKENKLMFSMVVSDYHSDLGGVFIGYAPKFPFQSLKSGEKIILKLLEKIKTGDFSDAYLESVKNILIQNHELALENGDSRMRKIAETFVAEADWKIMVTYPEIIRNLTKEDIISLANQYFSNNYLAFYSHMGSAKKERLTKPKLTPFKQYENINSEYYNRFEERLQDQVKPKYITNNLDFNYIQLKTGVNYYHVKNPYNNIFTYNLIFYVGEYEIPGLKMASSYLNQVGTVDMKFIEFKKKLQNIGTTIDITANESFFMIKMTGFDNYFEESLILLNQLLLNPEIDNKAGKLYISERKIENRLLKRDLGMKSSALTQYALYGKDSPFLNRLPVKDLKKLKGDDLANLIKPAIKYKVDISYTGKLPFDEIKLKIENHQFLSDRPKFGISPVIKKINLPSSSKIYFLEDKKALQSKMTITIPGKPINEDKRLLIKPYNLYYGSGLNSLIFREIREYKALAYTAFAVYRVPYKITEPGFLYCYTSTQSDKTFEALNTFYGLLDSLNTDENISYISRSLQNSINLNLPNFRNVSASVARWQLMGYNSDPRENQFLFYQNMNQSEILEFHENNVANRKKIITVIGVEEVIKNANLTKFGQVEIIKLKQLYTK